MRSMLLLLVLPTAGAIVVGIALLTDVPWLIIGTAALVSYGAVVWLLWLRRSIIANRWRSTQRPGASIVQQLFTPIETRIAGLAPDELDLADLRISATLARSSQGVEVLARRATKGLYGIDELRSLARSEPGVEMAAWPALANHDTLALSRVLHALREHRDDTVLALLLIRRLQSQGAFELLSSHDQLFFVTLLLEAGESAEAARALNSIPVGELLALQLRADLENPFETSGEPDPERFSAWLATFARIVSRDGLETVEVSATGEHDPFDRLTSTPRTTLSHRPEDPLVTIIMTTFRPGAEALSAVNSVLAQSWSRWELIVIDDASGESADAILDQIAALDDRILVHRRTENRGTYACRNTALDLATGELATVLDADDWMHPRRLELQVRDLQRSPNQMANVTNTLRVTQKLYFLHDRGPGIKLCEPALMYRRQQLLDRVGYYHEARKGADSELRWRIGVVQGFPVRHLKHFPPLTLQRFETGSLSGGDFVRGWVHPARIAYRSAWWSWHQQHRRLPSMLKLKRGATVPFPVPAHMAGTAKDRSTSTLDLVIALDCSNRASLRARQRTLVAVARSAARNGAAVGIAHLWTLAENPGGHLLQSSIVQKLVNSGRVVQVFPDDEVIAGVLLWACDAERSSAGAMFDGWSVDKRTLFSPRSAPRGGVADPSDPLLVTRSQLDELISKRRQIRR